MKFLFYLYFFLNVGPGAARLECVRDKGIKYASTAKLLFSRQAQLIIFNRVYLVIDVSMT